MDGNHGWEIQCFEIPKGLDTNSLFHVSAWLRCDASNLPAEKISTRMGIYDIRSKTVTGYQQFPVQDICKDEFTLVPFQKPVQFSPDRYLYIGGFLPSKVLQANVLVKSFIIKNARMAESSR